MNILLTKVIKDICEQNQIELLSLCDDWVFRLNKNDKTEYITGFKFPVNTATATAICDDKVATYEVLKNKKIDAIKHYPIYKHLYQNTDYSKYFDNSIVLVKDNNGTASERIYKAKNQEQLKDIITEKFVYEHIVALSPFVNINSEYRVIMFEGVAQIVYGKQIKTITGEGDKSVAEICNELDIDLEKIDIELQNYVPKKGEKVKLSIFHNLSKFGQYYIIQDNELKKKLIEIATKAVNAIGIKFCSVDIVKVDNELLVLEVNSGVMTENFGKDNYNIVKDMYEKVILSLF